MAWCVVWYVVCGVVWCVCGVWCAISMIRHITILPLSFKLSASSPPNCFRWDLYSALPSCHAIILFPEMSFGFIQFMVYFDTLRWCNIFLEDKRFPDTEALFVQPNYEFLIQKVMLLLCIEFDTIKNTFTGLMGVSPNNYGS